MFRYLFLNTVGYIYFIKLRYQLKHIAKYQTKTFNKILKQNKQSLFAKDYLIDKVSNYEAYQACNIVTNYACMEPYVNKIIEGQTNVMSINSVAYLAISSGTTAGNKYIPVSKKMIRFHKMGRLYYAANAFHNLGIKKAFLSKTLLFTDAPVFTKSGTYKTAAISAILANEMPWFVKDKNYPTKQTKNIVAYEEKIDAIIAALNPSEIGMIVGMPPMLLHFLKRKAETTSTNNWDYLTLISTSGMDYSPYKKIIEKMLPSSITHLQTYPATEGFMGFQLSKNNSAILLLPNNGVFYEFITTSDYENGVFTKYLLANVAINIDYIMFITTVDGLWSYMIGDIVCFESIGPPLINIKGRYQQSLNYFGEHFTQHEINKVVIKTNEALSITIAQVSIAASIADDETPKHYWVIEMDAINFEKKVLSQFIDTYLMSINQNYADLRHGKILNAPTVYIMPIGSIKKTLSEDKGTQYKHPVFINYEAMQKIVTTYNKA